MEFPVLFELDMSGEATGTVAPFCCNTCRDAARGNIGFRRMANGIASASDFGFTPQCEECGAEIK